MMYWNPIVVILCSLLLLFLLWKEIRRQNKNWLAARIAATIAAVVGLAGLAVPLHYHKKTAKNSDTEAILLTEGYNPDSLSAFLKKGGNQPVFSLVKNTNSSGAVYLPDAAFLNDDTSHYSKVHVFGNGLNTDELLSLKNLSFSFHPTPATTGITSIHWNQQLVLGDKLRVQGKIVNSQSVAATIFLEGFGVRLDSFLVPANGTYSFKLQTEPRHLDRAVYSIIVIAGKDTIAREPLPVAVTTSRPIRVLLLAAYPDFENKFLKNWLAQNGYPVVARTRISKEKFTKEYSNASGITLNAITPSFLSQFDVVVADATELAIIAPSELGSLQSAVSHQGKGLIVKMDSTQNGSRFYTGSFPLLQVKTSTPSTQKLHLFSDTAEAFGLLTTTQLLYIRPLPEVQPLVQTNTRQTVVSSRLYGAGKLLASTLGNTYTWQLSGKEKSYGAFWVSLLRQVAKKESQPESFSLQSDLPVVDEKAVIQLQTSFTEPPQVLAATDAVAMEQNWQLPYRWQGYYWPQKSGWVSVGTHHQTLNWFYIFGKNDWQSARAEAKKEQNQNGVKTTNQLSPQNRSATEVIWVEIPMLYFFLLFLLPASFLWFERKYIQG